MATQSATTAPVVRTAARTKRLAAWTRYSLDDRVLQEGAADVRAEGLTAAAHTTLAPLVVRQPGIKVTPTRSPRKHIASSFGVAL